MNFLSDNFFLSAAYQRPSGEIVLFVNNMIYMVDYPSFKLKEGWPERLSSLGFPTNILIKTVVNTNRGQTYAIFNNNDVVHIDECSTSVRSYRYKRYSQEYHQFRPWPSDIWMVICTLPKNNNFTNLMSS